MTWEVIKGHSGYYFSKKILKWRNKYCGILCNTANVLHTPLPFYATQIINRFLNSMISDNHDKVEGYSINEDILIKGIVSL